MNIAQRHLFVFAAVLAFATEASAEVALLVKQRGKIKYGQLVTVVAKNAAKAEFLVRPRGTKSQEITTSDGDPAVVFSSGCAPATFYIVCAAQDENGVLIDLLEDYVDVGSGPVPPRPDPDEPDPPGPGPAPTPPDPTLARLAKTQTLTLAERARGQASNVAMVFENAATAVVALQTPEQAKNLVKQGNAEVIGDNRAEWIEWMKAVGKYFDKLRDAGRLPDAASYAPYYKSVAIGMQQAR